MSEVFGQFFEAVEEINFPSSGSMPDLNAAAPLTKKPVDKEELGLVGKVIKTLDRINNNQFQSTESLAGMASGNSTDSLASVEAEPNPLNVKHVFGAVQSLTLNNYGSTNSLASEGDYMTEKPTTSDSGVVNSFIKVVDEFMHNHDSQQAEIAPKKGSKVADSMAGEETEIETKFPKFC